MTRKFKHNDIVIPKDKSRGFWPGRVWRRIDDNHVVVVDCGRYVTIYNEDDIVLANYNGRWLWGRGPDNEKGKKPVWSYFTSMRMLKKRAAKYNPHFGGRWTKVERQNALLQTQIYDSKF
jgi:hypothetical protein